MSLYSHLLPAEALTPGERCKQLRQYVFSGGPPSVGSPMYRCGLSKGADCSEMDKGPLSREWIGLKCWNFDPPGYYQRGEQGSNREGYGYSQAYTPNTCQFGGRVGRVIFKNDSPYPINVRLYHSDTGGVHATQRVEGGKTFDSGYNVGDSWGIQLGSSKVKCVGDASNWLNSSFYVDTSTFYR